MRLPTTSPPRGDERVIVAARGLLLIGGAVLTLIAEPGGQELAAVALLTVIATVATVSWFLQPQQSRWVPQVEAVAASLVMVLVEPLPETLLPYLMAPALAAGLTGGVRAATTATGLAAGVLLLGREVGMEPMPAADYYGTVSSWTLITLAVGLLGAWIRRLNESGAEAPDSAAYAAAYRLISQLRMVTRQLAGGLDPVALAQHLLDQLRKVVPFQRGAVYLRSGGSRLSPMAFAGADRLDWQVDTPIFDQAWSAAEPVRRNSALTAGAVGYSAIIPLRIGQRTVGLVAVERDRPPFGAAELAAATGLVEEQALRLDTALLFSEVRTMATAEERRRLAREIHDGIAQELASLGYLVDDLAARTRDRPDVHGDLAQLRVELTRVITELRLSIFDLRSEVQSTVSLGTALSDYVRQVGAGSHLTVHLVLDETSTRLPVDAETELLRIAQEAVTNARKHAAAANLWVSCRIDPPVAALCIEDDGRGMRRGRRVDSFGLQVMAERAERIGARLSVRDRAGGGTTVELLLGSADGSP